MLWLKSHPILAGCLLALVIALAINYRAVGVFLRVFVPLFLKKLPSALLTLWLVATMVFFMTKLAGDDVRTGEGRMDEATKQALRARWGLDRPWYVQYGINMRELLKLNTLPSHSQRDRTMRDIVREHLPASAALGFRSIVLAVILGMPIGIICALYHNRWADQMGSVFALVGVSVPSFILASCAIYFLARKWQIMPATEWTDPWRMWIPGACLGAFPFAAVLRLTRASMLETLREDYVRTARAKGVSEWKVVLRHALRNSLSSVVTYVGPVIAGVLLGSLVVEKIFAIPGLGDMFVKSVNNRDTPLIMGITVFYATLLIFMNLVVDSVYPVLNPKLREG